MYDIIKKQNGEGFARVLRDATLLEIKNLDQIVQFAGHTPEDAKRIIPYLRGLLTFETKETETPGDPFELLHKAGYEFVEYADTLEKQNAIKKYFRPGEELCTFKDQDRYKNYYIINAVKYNIKTIKPAPRDQEHRQDEYGTSVISIQILKPNGDTNISKHISIKNRYNHTVANPDNTFDSNPDKIIAGLSVALKSYFKVDWTPQDAGLPNGYTLIGNQILKYNFEINNCYIGTNFYERHGEIHKIDKNNQIMMDYFVYDNKTKQLLNPSQRDDGFVKAFNEEIKDKKIEIRGTAPNQSLYADGIEIVRTKEGQITYVNFPNIQEIGDDFLYNNKQLTEINLQKVETVGDNFLGFNKSLTEINLPELRKIGAGFLLHNKILNKLNLQKVETVGDRFLWDNELLTELNMPELRKIGDSFLAHNLILNKLNLQKVEIVGGAFLLYNEQLTELNLPNVREIGTGFLMHNKILNKLNLQKVETVGNRFLVNNEQLTELNLPELRKIGDGFLEHNKILNKLNLQKVEIIGGAFLLYNEQLTELNLPELRKISDGFLEHNKRIKITHRNDRKIEITILSDADDFKNGIWRIKKKIAGKFGIWRIKKKIAGNLLPLQKQSGVK